MACDEWEIERRLNRPKPTAEEIKQSQDELRGLKATAVIDEYWRGDGMKTRGEYKLMNQRRKGRVSSAFEELAKEIAQGGPAAKGIFLNRAEKRQLKKAEKRLGERIWG